MKKLYHFILGVIALCVLYVGSVLAFSGTMEKYGEKVGLSGINAKILQWIGKVNTYTTELDGKETIDKHLNKATQLKQKVQDGVQSVQNTVETIQNQGQQTIDAVTEAYDAGKKTIEAVNETVEAGKKAIDEVNKLQETVKDAVPKKKKKWEKDDEDNNSKD